MIKASFTILLLILTISIASLTASAQSTATLRGTVADESGATLVNAQIIIKDLATGVERTTQTDNAGQYQLAALPIGKYQIEAHAEGFQTQIIRDFTLEINQTAVQDFQLSIGGVEQEMVITADAPTIEKTSITVGQVINQRTVQEIPLNGRHFVDLGLLIPGSVTPPQNGFLTAPLRGQGSFAFNTAGNREDTVNFMINGINLNDMVQNQITFQPSINTVQEFKVNNSTYSAEYGRNSGAIVNIATRSGSNKLHGEIFEFIRNDRLDARNFFDGKNKGPFKRNQFGAALGGPILKDKTFFFVTYEGIRQRQGITINGNVLSDAQRASATDPTTQKLLAFIPRQNAIVGGAPGFVGAATAPVNIDQWTGDVSHVLTNNDRLHFYYAFQRDKRQEPILQGNTIPGFGDIRKSRRQIFTFNESHTFGANLVNEFRLGFNRIFITFTPNTPLNPTTFGINTGINESIGLPQINISGARLNFGGPAGFPQGRGDTTVVVSDSLSYLRGKHSFKFGGELRRFLNNNFARTPGTFNFPTIDDFLKGNANAFTVTLGDTSSSIAQGALGLFAQDNYKVRPNLTLELGLRYDWFMSPTERYDRFVVFDPRNSSLARVGTGIDQVYKTNHNIHPRLGIAWDPFKNGKTIVRAAYAILADQPVTNLITGTAGNPPLATPLTFTGQIKFNNAINVARAGGLAPITVDNDFKNAYVQSWNLNIQHEITPDLAMTIGYYGSKGTHLRVQRNINQLINGTRRPFATIAASSAILPGMPIGNILQNSSEGNSIYNALWITANKRFSRNMQFNASYTWSKSIDYNSLNTQGVVVQNSFDLRADRGPSDYDARHRFVINAIYELPLRGNRLVEGWQLSSIVQLQSGNPFNVITNINTFTGTATLRPDLIGKVKLSGDPTKYFNNLVFDPRTGGSPGNAAFAIPVSADGKFHFGNLGRNTFVGPGFNNVDLSVLKNTKLTEKMQLQIRAEVFDLFNHANFGQPGRIAVVGSTNFGVINSTRFSTGDSGSSRQMQIAVKLTF
ncbi:MAG: TonB-dependent receptor [Acidobacteriota bacterium]